MKRLLLSTSLLILVFFSVACTKNTTHAATKPIIYTTLFLTYDFAHAIAGDKMQVELFLPAGVDTHSYEPSANDMLKAKNASLFIWTSKSMEPWMPRVIETLGLAPDQLLNLADTLHLHTLNGGKNHNHDHDHDHHHHDGEDPHFWMDPTNLLPLFDSIMHAIITLDPANQAYYEQNANHYRERLMNIVTEIDEITQGGNKKPLLFGGGFSHQYFIDAYALPYYSVYMSDSIENEPTIAHLAEIYQAINDHDIKVIFVDPMLTTKIAQTLAQDANLEILPWHTGHTLSKEDMDAGLSYLDLLKENNHYLRTALYQ